MFELRGAAALVSMLMLASCSFEGDAEGGAGLADADTDMLDNQVLALAMSTPLTSDISASSGTVILVDASGKTTQYEHRGIDMAAIDGADGRLYFSDRTHDYIAGVSSAAHERPTTQYTHAAMLARPGGRFLSAFNTGYGSEGYEFTIISGDNRAAGQKVLPWYLDRFASCGDRIYAIALDEKSTDRLEKAPRILIELDGSEPGYRVIGRKAPSMLDPGGSPMRAPCHDGRLYSLNMRLAEPGASAHDYHDTQLVSWDVTRGQQDAVTLTRADGQPLPQTATSWLAGHFHEGAFYWITARGDLYRAHPRSGLAEKVSTIPLADPDMGPAAVRFADDQLHVVDLRDDDATWARIRLEDGQTVSETSLPAVAEVSKESGQVLMDLAVLTD